MTTDRRPPRPIASIIKLTTKPSSSEYTSGDAKPHQSANDPHILIILGDDKIYTAEERHAWNGWCLLIQGEEIKYFQDSRRLYVVDADGYKCKLDILKQENRSSP